MRSKLLFNYRVFLIICGLMVLTAFFFDTPIDIFQGFLKIQVDPSILISDYTKIGGVGASFMNASILCFVFILILIRLDVKPNGSTLAALFIILGFGFCGKNLLNVWPVFLGCMLFAKYKNQPARNYILVALFATSLSPVVNQVFIANVHMGFAALLKSIGIGLLVGFLLPPVTTYCMKLHEGYTLSNAGFASGLVATMMVSIFRAFGINFEVRDVWGSAHSIELSIFLYVVSIGLIIAGLREEKNPFRNVFDIWDEPGKLVTDFTILYGFHNTYINMGILGVVYTSIILILGGQINGVIVAGIFTVIGFGAFGKHLRNTLPVSFGAVLGSLLNIWPVTSPQMLLSILFSTTLSPITGSFGTLWGIIAGFLHTCITMNISYISGGINLYSNGFAGGVVVIILLPIISSIRKEGRKR